MKITIQVPSRSHNIGSDARYTDIPIHYSPLNETEYVLDIPSRTRLETLRNIIRDRENLPIIPDPGIRFRCPGSLLVPYDPVNQDPDPLNHGTLFDYNINEDSVIIVWFRIRG